MRIFINWYFKNKWIIKLTCPLYSIWLLMFITRHLFHIFIWIIFISLFHIYFNNYCSIRTRAHIIDISLNFQRGQIAPFVFYFKISPIVLSMTGELFCQRSFTRAAPPFNFSVLLQMYQQPLPCSWPGTMGTTDWITMPTEEESGKGLWADILLDRQQLVECQHPSSSFCVSFPFHS